jgi:hypothetical protein
MEGSTTTRDTEKAAKLYLGYLLKLIERTWATKSIDEPTLDPDEAMSLATSTVVLHDGTRLRVDVGVIPEDGS